MFERRLKILLIVLLIASAALVIRAAQIQILQHDQWRKEATETMKRDEFIETTRGKILDRHNLALAIDAPCTDACVDYRAIPEDLDPNWLLVRARQNLRNRLGDQYKSASHSSGFDAMLSDESNRVREDLAAMWQELAIVGDKSPEEIDQIRRDIVQRVEMRKRYKWWHNYDQAARSERENSTKWYRQFLSDTAPDDSAVDKFEVEVSEEISPHMILHRISPEVQARLARQGDRFFCISLVPSKYRAYPFGRAACNVLGYLDTARPEEITADADITDAQVQDLWTAQAQRLWPQDQLDHYGIPTFRELRKYWPADLVGRVGVESLCENTLRGTRGKIERVAGPDHTERVVDQIDSIPGKNVSTTIDILVQQDVEAAFAKTRVHKGDTGELLDTRFNQHGAAVAIKVDTGEVLALVSNPGFDLNDLNEHFADYASDELNRPMTDRATELAVEPGSTVKPMVGSGSITDGIMRATDKIQCRGVLYIAGKAQQHGHCWIYDLCLAKGLTITHGLGGGGDERIGQDDMLTITDGIRVSCNVVFETIALKMGMLKLSNWFDRFGLGQRTGIGIEESPGLLYHPTHQIAAAIDTQALAAGIGEGPVHATPLQMANVAATIARNGVWMRPRLVNEDQIGRSGVRAPSALGPDRVDLHLSSEAITAVQTGMRQVCEPYSSGMDILPENNHGPDDPPIADDPIHGMQIAGKTGSAQTGKFMTLVDHDANGKPTGMREIHFGDPGTDGWYMNPDHNRANPDPHPERHLAHAWFIGYAPADHPQVAFCVLVEYGEGGDRVAGPIAHDLLVSCVKHGYLSPAR